MKSAIKISLNKMFIDGRFIFIYQILYLRGPLCTGTSGPVFSAGTSGPVFTGTSGPVQNRKDGNRKHF